MEVTDTQLAERFASLSTIELVDLFNLDTLTQQARSILDKELASRGVDPGSYKPEESSYKPEEKAQRSDDTSTPKQFKTSFLKTMTDQKMTRSIFERHAGEIIGMNMEAAGKPQPVQLVSASGDFFTVGDSEKGDFVHVPFHRIVLIEEIAEGREMRAFLAKIADAKLFVHVDYPTVYKGFVGVSF